MKSNIAMYRNILLCLAIAPCSLFAQMVVNTGSSPNQLVQNVLTGGGVVVSNVQFSGSTNQALSQIGSFTAAGTNLGIGNGVVLSTGDVVTAANAQGTGIDVDFNTPSNDLDLLVLSGANGLNDAAILDFDFIATGNMVTFTFVFASDEYGLYTCSQFNDAFGFFLSGPGINGPFQNSAVNLALVPGSTVPITINTVNAGVAGPNYNAGTCGAADPNWLANTIFYVNNAAGASVEFAGFTVPLQATSQVQCGQAYHIKLAIADAFDGSFDSAVFLQAGSFISPPISLAMSGAITAPCADQINVSVQSVGGGNAPFNFQWSSEGVALGNAQAQSTQAGVAHYVKVDVSDACGATATDSVLISPQPFNLVMPQDQTIACLTAVDLLPQLQQAGANAAFAFDWTTGGNSLGTAQTLNVNAPGQPTQFTFTATDECGSTASGTVQVSTIVNAPISVTASDDLVIPCSADSAQVSVASVAGGDGNYSFTWTHDGVAVGTAQTIGVDDSETSYNVSVTDGCGASGSDDVAVSTQQFPPMAVSVSEDITVFCAGDNATVTMLNAQGGEAPYTMNWTDVNNAPVSQDQALSVAVPADAAYALTITDQCGNTATDIVNVLTPDYAPLTVTMTPDQVVCFGNTVELAATPSGGSGVYTFSWPATGATADNISVSPTTASTFSVVVTEFCGASASASMSITVEEPVVNLVATNIEGEEWAFSAFSTPAPTEFAWDFGDGTGSEAARPTHEYLDLIGHVAEVTITTANGCSATDTVHLNTESHFFLPNAFTPNGDGINDTFGPVGSDLVEFEMTIYDRWGAGVFAMEGVGSTWDGRTANGDMAPQGVYVYRYRVSGERMPEKVGLGHLTLTGDETAQN